MIPYFVLFGIWLLGSIQFSKRGSPYEWIVYVGALIYTILMIGLRHQVGGDWVTYEKMYNDIALQPLSGAFSFTEPAYALMNWLSAQFNGGVYWVNLGCAIVFMLGLSALVRKQPRPWLAMTVATPYLVIVVGMGYTRQAAAIGVICWAISTIEQDKIWKIVAKVAFAALFHKTAILFLPILLAPIARRNLLMAIVGSILFAALALIALGGSSDRLVNSYVNSDYQSSGAAIRVGMNLLSAIVFFYFRDSFRLERKSGLVWTIIAGFSVLSPLGLLLSSSSVGVDRLSLFFIPLQVFTYSNLPDVSSLKQNTKIAALIGIIMYSFAVEYVYFFQGTFSYTWLPYQNAMLLNEDKY